jgi:hypothetical protein
MAEPSDNIPPPGREPNAMVAKARAKLHQSLETQRRVLQDVLRRAPGMSGEDWKTMIEALRSKVRSQRNIMRKYFRR